MFDGDPILCTLQADICALLGPQELGFDGKRVQQAAPHHDYVMYVSPTHAHFVIPRSLVILEGREGIPLQY